MPIDSHVIVKKIKENYIFHISNFKFKNNSLQIQKKSKCHISILTLSATFQGSWRATHSDDEKKCQKSVTNRLTK